MVDLERSAVGAAPGEPAGEKRFRHQIEAGVSISGRIHFPGDARIDGQLKGEIRADRLLWVGEEAELEATVSAQHMVLAGTLRGDVIRSGTVELEPTARLWGNVEAKNLVVRAGACFDGRATIGKSAAATPTKRTGGTGASPTLETQGRRASA